MQVVSACRGSQNLPLFRILFRSSPLLRIVFGNKISFFDGDKGPSFALPDPTFGEPGDASVCGNGFDAYTNLIMFTEDPALTNEAEPIFLTQEFRTDVWLA